MNNAIVFTFIPSGVSPSINAPLSPASRKAELSLRSHLGTASTTLPELLVPLAPSRCGGHIGGGCFWNELHGLVYRCDAADARLGHCML